MPTPTPFSSSNMLPAFPALYLYPLNADAFVKHINLTNNQRVKIGRQTNARTVPAENNGYFDSKVLSRQHAEVWEEGGKIFIKDVKSSNGTFINGERLSPEGLESEPYELKSDDIVEFGIDIVGEDNKTIIHHKVAARVVCVFSEQDAHVAARAEQHQHQLQQQSSSSNVNLNGSNGSSNSSGPGGLRSGNMPNGATGSANFSFAGHGGPGSTQRRPPMQPQGLGGMGGMGGSMRPPGKSGLTFDHILSRLQGELQKSRETGAELHNLTGAMSDIHDTLGGSIPANLPSYPQALPAVRPPQPQEPSPAAPAAEQKPSVPPSSTLGQLQIQLQDTQTSLANHVDKVRALDGIFKEHEAIKREVAVLRQLVESKTTIEERREEDEEFGHTDDDDARSIRTIVPHELERVEEEDEDQLARQEEDEEDDRRRRAELGRPRTPEPMGMGMSITEDDDEPPRRQGSMSPRPPTAVDELTQRLTTLSNQLESALALSSTLQAQHTAAQATISVLESKVQALESLVKSTQMQPQPPPVEATPPPSESLTQMLNEWKKTVEGQWTSVREEWASERERLASAREEWEAKAKTVESTLGSATAKVDASIASLALAKHQHGMGNGDAKVFHGTSGGLVTPPSPRSLSADSNRPRHRRKRSSSSRGRACSNSREVNGHAEHEYCATTTHISTPSRSYSPSIPDDSSDSDSLRKDSTDSNTSSKEASIRYLETPESSVLRAPVTSSTRCSSPDSLIDPLIMKENGGVIQSTYSDAYMTHTSAAVGVLVLSIAAAAVLWRVKPE